MSLPQHSDDSPPANNTVVPAGHMLAKAKQQSHVEAQEFAEAIIATVPTPLLVLDANLAVTMANDAFYHHFRISPRDTLGQPIWMLGNGEWNVASLRRLLSDVLPRNASVVNYEISHNFQELGQRIMLLNGRTVLPPRGRAKYVLLAIQDITAQRNAESELKEVNKQLRRNNEEVTLAYNELESFSYSVSHDLRAPLRGIEGFSQAILEDYADKLDEAGKDYLKRIRAGTVRMAKLIDDILQLSRLSRMTMEITDVDLRAEAETIVHELQRSAPERQVEVKLPEHAHTPGDRQLLVILLTNLLSNAWKFSSKTENALVEFGVQGDPGHEVFFVRDNGIGFEAQYAERIFQPFNRLHSAADYPGSGIGLAIVHRVVRRHHGLIWATSVPGRGATFYFTLTPDTSQ